ncbi:heterokaryon incompatibility protein-domain-containing protein [Halenospora varia]|nr:heterokaryon incompatibility protein-domain-containing protein [Halenospora varia]
MWSKFSVSQSPAGTYLEEAHRWLDECVQNHEKCKSTQTRLPTRIIDVGSSDGSRDPYLFIPSADLHARSSSPKGQECYVSTRYVALSYCWGEGLPLKTTTTNILDLQKGIPWDTIPSTIQDAITITRKFDIRYLWVDALCIIQDLTEDWEAQCTRMSEVYGGSFFTIAAALSPNVDFGIPRRRPRLPVRTYNDSTTRIDSTHDGDPLYKRGWAVQERILSQRVLVFASNQMFWECQSVRPSENGSIIHVFHPRIKDEDFYFSNPTLWHQIVNEYSCRDLTFEGDKLPAIAGIARRIQHVLKDDYLAGCWKNTMILDLLWYRAYDSRINILTAYRAPSWSWACHDGEVLYYPFTDLTTCSKLLRYHIDVAGSDLMGQLLGGYIELFGPLIIAHMNSGYWIFDRFSQKVGGAHWDINERDSNGEVTLLPQGKLAKQGKLWLLLLAASEIRGLGLILLRNSSPDGATFKRIGTFQSFTEKPFLGYKGLEKNTIKEWVAWFSSQENKSVVIV